MNKYFVQHYLWALNIYRYYLWYFTTAMSTYWLLLMASINGIISSFSKPNWEFPKSHSFRMIHFVCNFLIIVYWFVIASCQRHSRITSSALWALCYIGNCYPTGQTYIMETISIYFDPIRGTHNPNAVQSVLFHIFIRKPKKADPRQPWRIRLPRFAADFEIL